MMMMMMMMTNRVERFDRNREEQVSLRQRCVFVIIIIIVWLSGRGVRELKNAEKKTKEQAKTLFSHVFVGAPPLQRIVMMFGTARDRDVS